MDLQLFLSTYKIEDIKYVINDDTKLKTFTFSENDNK